MDFKDCKKAACGGRATAKARYADGGNTSVPVVPIVNQMRKQFDGPMNNVTGGDPNDERVNQMILNDSTWGTK